MAVPSTVDVVKGIVYKSTDIIDTTEAFRLRRMQERRLWKRAWVDNASNASLTTAMLLGAAKGVDSLARMIIGSRAGRRTYEEDNRSEIVAISLLRFGIFRFLVDKNWICVIEGTSLSPCTCQDCTAHAMPRQSTEG